MPAPVAAVVLPGRPGPLARLRAWRGPHALAQILLVAFVAALFALAGRNIAETMHEIGLSPGFAFLDRSADFEIGESLTGFRGGDPYRAALLAGFLNTLKVALAGCVLATILGTLLGITGLSRNPLVAGLVRTYVELVRGTPLLLQLFFWIALAQALPAPRQALSAFDALFLTNRGVYVPGLVLDAGTGPFWTVLALGFAGTAATLLALRSRSALRARPVLLVLLAGGVTVAAAFAFSGASLRLAIPSLAGFNIRGGHVLTPEFAALLTGLTVKFSAAIAEIVRAGIQSVGQGQWEAARAVGLSRAQILRLVVLPQALRVITPMVTSSYLDLVKDSSLAVAIGYPDLVSVVNTTANTTGQSLEALLILISAYLALNLSISGLMNLHNHRVVSRGSSRS